MLCLYRHMLQLPESESTEATPSLWVVIYHLFILSSTSITLYYKARRKEAPIIATNIQAET
jgi:hypothetical protein